MNVNKKKIILIKKKATRMSQIPSKTGNERYPTLSKSYDHFCAGDYEQFVENLCFDPTTGDASEKKYTLHDVLITFEYMFHKFKKGLFFQIRNNELKTFLPFSKINYQNNWGHIIQIDPMFGKDKNDLFRFRSMLDTINKGTKYENYDINFQRNFEEWYANNGLFRFEYPLQEFDSGYPMLYDMLLCLSKERKLPDTDGFLNKRDFPIVNQDRTEPYYHLFGHGQPIEPKYQKQFDRFLPIWSMNSGENNLDWKIPTWEDWRFFEYQRHGKIFTEKKTIAKLILMSTIFIWILMRNYPSLSFVDRPPGLVSQVKPINDCLCVNYRANQTIKIKEMGNLFSMPKLRISIDDLENESTILTFARSISRNIKIF